MFPNRRVSMTLVRRASRVEISVLACVMFYSKRKIFDRKQKMFNNKPDFFDYTQEYLIAS